MLKSQQLETSMIIQWLAKVFIYNILLKKSTKETCQLVTKQFYSYFMKYFKPLIKKFRKEFLTISKVILSYVEYIKFAKPSSDLAITTLHIHESGANPRAGSPLPPPAAFLMDF